MSTSIRVLIKIIIIKKQYHTSFSEYRLDMLREKNDDPLGGLPLVNMFFSFA
jgi:hypothetical protein